MAKHRDTASDGGKTGSRSDSQIRKESAKPNGQRTFFDPLVIGQPGHPGQFIQPDGGK